MTAGGTREGDELDQVREPAVAGNPDATRSSRSNRRHARWGIFVGLAVLVIAVDQLTKAWLVSAVEPGGAIEVVGDWLRLIYGRNNGGLFGLFEGSAALLAVASLAVIGIIVVYHARSQPSVVLSTALGLLLGGAIGNLIDRVRLGYVIDFVDAGIGSLRFYTFNVADSAISLSILLLILLALFPGLAGSRTTEADRADA
jgi:signal peptidase II